MYGLPIFLKQSLVFWRGKFCHHPPQIDRGRILVGENFSHSLKILVIYARLFFPDKVLTILSFWFFLSVILIR